MSITNGLPGRGAVDDDREGMALFPSSFPFPSLSLPPRVVNVCVFLLCHGARNAYLPRQLPYRVHGREANASDKDDGSSAACR